MSDQQWDQVCAAESARLLLDSMRKRTRAAADVDEEEWGPLLDDEAGAELKDSDEKALKATLALRDVARSEHSG